MEKIITYSPDHCFICSEIMGDLKNDLASYTSFSEKPIADMICEFFLKYLDFCFIIKKIILILAAFTETIITEDIITDAGICQNCFMKFDEFDELQSKAEQIQQELVSLFEASNAMQDDKPDIKSEPEQTYEEAMYEMIEEDVKEPTEHLLIENEEPDYNNDQIVDYEWLTIGGMPVEMIEPKQIKKPPPSNPKKYNKAEENFVVVMQGADQKAYQCDICQRLFKERSKLRAHRDIHTTERNVICPVS